MELLLGLPWAAGCDRASGEVSVPAGLMSGGGDVIDGVSLLIHLLNGTASLLYNSPFQSTRHRPNSILKYFLSQTCIKTYLDRCLYQMIAYLRGGIG